MSRAHYDAVDAWPSERQELLLRAALADAPAATVAWQTWQACTDLVRDPVDAGSLRLLPLVYLNLTRHRYDDPLMPRLKGIYRYWWLHNQGTFRAATDVIRWLADRGIETMTLKGIALAELYYRDRAARPMADFDVMVPAARAAEAVAALGEAGWVEAGSHHPWRFRFYHAAQLFDGAGMSCDLHWHLRWESTGPGADNLWWQHSTPYDFEGTATRVLDPTCMLIHTVAHGVPWNRLPSLRWVADAVTVLASAGDDIDWNLILEVARRERLVVRMYLGLRYLQRRHEARVPPWLLEALEKSPVSTLERLGEPVTTMAASSRQQLPFRVSRALLTHYLRLVASRGIALGTLEYPDLLVFHFDLQQRQQLPGALFRKAVRKLTSRVARRQTVVPP